MKYFIGGIVVFIFNLIFVMIIGDRAPNILLSILIVIALLYLFFGVQTIRLENKYLVGPLFFILAIISILMILQLIK